MKIPIGKPCHPAFTLIEVLTVITIIGVLTALACLIIRVGIAKSREKDTINLLTGVSKSLEDFRADRGYYPRPAEDGDTTSIDGETYPVSGARMLYQILSGDGTDAVKGGEKKSTGHPGSAQDSNDLAAGRIYMDTVIAPSEKQIDEGKHAKWVGSGESGYYLVDSWRHPVQYQIPELDKNGVVSKTEEMHSGSSFELWSFGKLKKPGDSAEARREWITTNSR